MGKTRTELGRAASKKRKRALETDANKRPSRSRSKAGTGVEDEKARPVSKVEDEKARSPPEQRRAKRPSRSRAKAGTGVEDETATPVSRVEDEKARSAPKLRRASNTSKRSSTTDPTQKSASTSDKSAPTLVTSVKIGRPRRRSLTKVTKDRTQESAPTAGTNVKRGRPRRRSLTTDPTQESAPTAGTNVKRGRPRKETLKIDPVQESALTSVTKVKRERPIKGTMEGVKSIERKGTVRTDSIMKPSKAADSEVKKRRYVSRVVLDGVEYHIGDDVYVTKSESTGSESDTEVEVCQICGAVDDETMVECDSCLDGFHLICLDPPLKNVPEDDWVCPYCERGEKPPGAISQRRHRSARERFLAADLWAARIERMWREVDGSYWFTAHWFLIPEETALGRQPHNGKRELFRSSQKDDNEMESILRHCFVMSPQEYKQSTEGNDVFFCAYEYNEQWCKFKRIEYLDENENGSEGSSDELFGTDESGSEDDLVEHAGRRKMHSIRGRKNQSSNTVRAANKRRNYSCGIEEVGAKTIPQDLKKRPQTDFEQAKSALALSAIPSSLPCRDKERKEITAFLKDSVAAGEHCLGRCLYISGVPGTGKTATVMEVIKELGNKVDLGELPPYRFVEINGLRLPSPEHAYTVLHEALTGQHVGWKRALQMLDERFSNARPLKGLDARPCVLLVDELDLLVTRNQSVLYNIFDWPSRPHSRLIILGIANTMDLPERMLPRIASRMGMQRISFAPYTHKQLEEIISARLKGVPVFDQQAAEFASRKVAAVSGDIRRALELCRRAVEVAEARLKTLTCSDIHMPGQSSSAAIMTTTRGTEPGLQANSRSITMADVDAAISEMFEAPQIQMMKRSAKLAKVFLVAMVCEQRRTSMSETTFEKVATACSELCSTNGEECPDWDTLLAIGCKLGATRLLLCEPGVRHRMQKLQLNFPCDDVSFALKKDEQAPWLTKYL